MSVPKEVLDLVERFGQHLDDYRNGRYTETQVRRDYIDPLLNLRDATLFLSDSPHFRSPKKQGPPKRLRALHSKP